MLGNVLSKPGARRNAFFLAQGTALGYGLVFLASPLLTRCYSAPDFGKLQVYLAVLGIGLSVVTARYEWALFIPEDDVDAASIVVLGVVIASITSGIYGLLLFAALHLRTVFPSLGPISGYIWMVPIAMWGAGIYGILSQWLIRQKEYKEVVVTKITQSTGQIVIQLLSGYFTPIGALGLILGDAFGKAGGTIRMLRSISRTSRATFKGVTWSRMKILARRYRAFPLISSGSALINATGSGIPILMIGAFYGESVLGWFALIERILTVPVVVLGQAISQVYVSEASGMIRDDVSQLRLRLLKLVCELAAVAAVPFALMWALAPWLIARIFGSNWLEAGHYARILIPMDYLAFIVWPFMPTLNLVEKQSWQLGWDIGRLLITTGGILLANDLGLSPRRALAIYSGTMLLAYGTHLTLTVIALSRSSKSINI